MAGGKKLVSRRNPLSRLATLCFAILPFAIAEFSPDPPENQKATRTFLIDVLPIVKANCLSCHNEDSAAAGLRLDTFEAVMEGGASGASVISKNPDQSILLQRIKGHGDKPRMPMGFKSLDSQKISTIEAWIQQGAQKGSPPPPHWSYQRVERPSVPDVQSSWVSNPIDSFILQRLTAEGFKPSPAASNETLVRRVYLDILGIPPTREEAEAFLNDKSADAYEKMVDKCLSSPHYGERQARMWLDYARYADTNGYEADRSRVIWPWRDYVIQSFNENKPFSEFTLEQIAGDMLSNATTEQLVATGYHRNAMFNEEGGIDQGEYRWLTLVDRVANTGSIWLGSSIACAQCHDHKYDPFSQKEFYQFLAFWESAEEPKLILSPDEAAQKADLAAKIANIDEKLKAASEEQKPPLQEERKLLQAKHDAIEIKSTLILREKPDAQPETPIRERGMYLSPGEIVQPDVPDVLGSMPAEAPKTRLGLAEWLVSRENPLTARVQVNRYWEQHFGYGLVKTIDDFGTQGEVPVHKNLLDWLSVEFMESGWDMKRIHRLIVLSSAYKQSSNVNQKLLESDPENRLMGRGPRFRLEAEAIRDSVLTVSGLLTRPIGGPSVMPSQPAGIWDSPYNLEQWHEATGPDRYRRSVYTYWKRNATYPMFVTFDSSTREICTPLRIRTNTPLQALNMMNDPAIIEACLSLADRAKGGSAREQISYMFQACLIRQATRAELDELHQLHRQMKQKFSADLAATKSLTKSENADLAARTLVANVIMNLDEFLSIE